MRRSLKYVLAGGLSLAIGGLAMAKPASFAEIAPADTAVLVNIPNFSAVKASFERSGLMELWNDKSLRNWIDQATEEPLSELKEQLNSMNLSMDDLKAPQGLAGAALWIEMAGNDPESGTMHLLAAGDFGDDADAMAETVATLIKRGEQEKEFTVAYDEFAGTEITVLTMLDKAEDDAEGEDDWGGDENDMAPEKMHYARAGTMLIISSSMDALEDALEAIGGKDIASAGDSADLAATLAQHPAGVQAYAALLNQPLFSLTEKLAAAEATEIPVKLLSDLGLLDVRAASMGLNMEPRTGLMEQTIGVLMSQKRGLWSLIDVPAARFQPPAFASADSAQVAMYHFNFAGLLPLIKSVTANTEDPNLQMAAQQLPMIEQTIGPILNSLGSRVYGVQSYARPLSATSARNVVAIDLKDREAFSNALAGFAPMLGLEARDFQGNQIWASPDGGMMLPIDISIAAAGGFAYFGSSQAIEDALRQADRAGGLGQEDNFAKAMGALGNDGLSFGWADTRQMLKHAEWMWKNQEAIIRQQVTEMFGDDPEFDDWRKEMIDERLAEMPEWMKNPPDVEAILRHVGDSVFEFNNTPDGIRGRVLWLKPAS